MAYMSQEKKAKIKAELDKVVPRNWKWSLSVLHHSTIVFTVRSAPTDLVQAWVDGANADRARHGDEPLQARGHVQVNEYHMDSTFSGALLEMLDRIKDALNLDNHDRSDAQSDHFDVGHYISINFGAWNKPFICTTAQPEQVRA